MRLRLFKGMNFIFTIILFFSVFTIYSQEYNVKGTVSDANGPLPGVSVLIKGTSQGTVTDFDGNFSLTGVKKGSTVEFSFIGYKTQNVVIENGNALNIAMEQSAEQLGEVVITALGIKREQKAIGYSVQAVDGESLQKVAGANVGTSLTGKVAGLLVKNSTDFGISPDLSIRGEEPLLVIDGIAYANKKFSDISAEDIESLNILKGATASALYGFRGAAGAILITTKSGSYKNTGLSVGLSTNTMFTAGFLAIPEKQSIYGRGNNGIYDQNSSNSWGPLMDGTIRTQWDPYAMENRDYAYLPIGANNFKNFLEQGYVTNNNLEVAFSGENSSLRSSINWIQNKGIYPNSSQNKYTYSLAGDIKVNKFNLSSNLSYSRNDVPNLGSNGYTSYDPMYSLLIWSPADFDIRDYKDNYWKKKNETQNYTYQSGINNPYFDRYEKTNEVSRDIFNADVSANYKITDWLDATVRSGVDFYMDRGQLRVSWGSYVSTGNTAVPGNLYTWNGTKTGAYVTGRTQGMSINSDLLFSGNKEFGKFGLEYLAGGTIFYQRDDTMYGSTSGGISLPGYFSLKASVNSPTVTETTYARQVNSIYGRFGLSWNKLIYLDFTGRNDWSSTLVNNDVSYFYPSVSGSFVVSELLPESTKSWIDLLKLRNSWTSSKTPAAIYATNSVYTVTSPTWNALTGATAPSSLYSNFINPQSSDNYEMGLQGIFYKKRLNLDVTYYKKHKYDFLKYSTISSASGYTSYYLNTNEERDVKGWEVTLGGTPIKKENLTWDLNINWSTYKEVYSVLDPINTTNYGYSWVKVGNRYDAYVGKDFLKDPATGQNIYSNGRIQRSSYNSVFGYVNPDWLWGLNSTLKYKNFSLFFSLDGVVGGLMNTRTESYMWQAGVHPDSVTEERALDVATINSKNYIGDGVVVTSGSVTYDSYGNITSDTRVFAPNTIASTYQQAMTDLHNSSAWGGTGTPVDAYEKTFFKLREISLTYDIPNTFLDKMLVKKASISLIGQNVFMWAKDFKYSDPDGGTEDFSDPSLRYLGANVKLSF